MVQVQFTGQRFEACALRPLARDNHWNVRHANQGVQQIVEALLRRQASEIKQVAFILRKLVVAGKRLEMGQHLDALGRKPVIDQLAADEFAGSEKQVDATFVTAQPLVQIGFRCQNYRAGAGTRIAPFGNNVIEGAVPAGIAGLAAGDEIIGWAQNFEVIQVIDDRHAPLPKFPKNGRR